MISEKICAVLLSIAKDGQTEDLLTYLLQYIDERLSELKTEILEEETQRRIEVVLKDPSNIFKK